MGAVPELQASVNQKSLVKGSVGRWYAKSAGAFADIKTAEGYYLVLSALVSLYVSLIVGSVIFTFFFIAKILWGYQNISSIWNSHFSGSSDVGWVGILSYYHARIAGLAIILVSSACFFLYLFKTDKSDRKIFVKSLDGRWIKKEDRTFFMKVRKLFLMLLFFLIAILISNFTYIGHSFFAYFLPLNIIKSSIIYASFYYCFTAYMQMWGGAMLYLSGIGVLGIITNSD